MPVERITKILITKSQTAFIEKDGCNGVGVVSGSVSEIASLLTRYENKGCKFVFDMHNAPSFKRWFNACVKRIGRIANEAGVSIGEPMEYEIKGFRQGEQFFCEVL